MTQRQIDAAKKTLPPRREYHTTWTSAQKRLDSELSCREMINSCLVYHGERFGEERFWEEREYAVGDKSYAAPFVRTLGKERVLVLWSEQVRDFRQARVFYNSFEDSEGLTYNSIRWADDL